MKKLFTIAAILTFCVLPHANAQTSCRGTTIAGVVRDSTLALVPGATIALDENRTATSGSDGKFRFTCIADGPHHLLATAEGFAQQDISVSTPHNAAVDLTLHPAGVETEVNVDADTEEIGSSTTSGPTEKISGTRLQSLADDPDDLLRELQQLAAASGGSSSNATIAVDGFQDSSKLPPKSSIAYIKVNPDQFSAEYREPPFDGGRVEIYTKPGQPTYHGAFFLTNGSPWENASDPFTTSKAPLGKQRYGFELTGPVRRSGSDFALTLEHRSIDNFGAVNAVTLDDSYNPVSTTANVAEPQRLWLGTARLDWQLGPENTFIASYSANVNHLQNVGVGGTVLPSAGYDSQRYEHMFRLSDVTTVSAHFMHEARLSLKWDGETDQPDSTTAQLQVAGAFTGGGADIGAQRLREFNIEADDDAILTTKNHTLKFGTQFMLYDEHQQLTTNFNGTYIFGGDTAPVLDTTGNAIPGETETITGLQQYQRTLRGQAGGTATAFTNVAGTPAVNFTLAQDAAFVQDDWNAGHNVHVSYGLRYFLQNNPTIRNSFTPRLGIAWSPEKKATWTLHAHAGMFSGRFGQGIEAEVRREDGVERTTSTIYNAAYTPGNSLPAGTPVHSVREFAPKITNVTWQAENIGGTRAFPHGWNFSIDYYIGRFWNETRTVNINSPLNDSPTGPRPGAPNLDVLQIQNSGQGNVNVTFVGVEQHKLKHVQFFVGGTRVVLIDDTDDDTLGSPQSAYSNAGEFAPRTSQSTWNIFGNATFSLPRKIQLSSNLEAPGNGHYNITTGFDNNGDGNFNDRPQYAAPGTPAAVATRYGLLTATGGTGVLRRNTGIMPWKIYLDANLQRAFNLTRNAKAEHRQTLAVNLRSSNLLNHTNVTQVGGVLGSPLFGRPYAADNGRRIEAGLRYSF